MFSVVLEREGGEKYSIFTSDNLNEVKNEYHSLCQLMLLSDKFSVFNNSGKVIWKGVGRIYYEEHSVPYPIFEGGFMVKRLNVVTNEIDQYYTKSFVSAKYLFHLFLSSVSDEHCNLTNKFDCMLYNTYNVWIEMQWN